MRIKNTVLFLFFPILFLGQLNLYAQEEENKEIDFKHTLYLELFGNGGYYSINYGYNFYQNKNLKLVASVGIGHHIYSVVNSTTWQPSLPFEFSALFGKKKHHLELGIGFTPFIDSEVIAPMQVGSDPVSKGDPFVSALIPFRIGYRNQKPGRKFFYRIAYTPYFKLPTRNEDEYGFQEIYLGFSFGWSY